MLLSLTNEQLDSTQPSTKPGQPRKLPFHSPLILGWSKVKKLTEIFRFLFFQAKKKFGKPYLYEEKTNQFQFFFNYIAKLFINSMQKNPKFFRQFLLEKCLKLLTHLSFVLILRSWHPIFSLPVFTFKCLQCKLQCGNSQFFFN